jgi:hypothetical protein
MVTDALESVLDAGGFENNGRSGTDLGFDLQRGGLQPSSSLSGAGGVDGIIVLREDATEASGKKPWRH